IPFILPPDGSGSAATFKTLMQLDPNGIGRAKNISYANDVSSMLDQVAAGNGVGLFVQFADPSNAIIRKVVDLKLEVVPVISKEVVRAKIGDETPYQVQEFTFSEAGLFSSAVTHKTACTPVVIITGNPPALPQVDQNDQAEMVKTIQSIS